MENKQDQNRTLFSVRLLLMTIFCLQFLLPTNVHGKKTKTTTAPEDSIATTCAVISKIVYKKDGKYSNERLAGWEFLGVDVRDKKSGFHGTAFGRDNQIIIVFEGTEPESLSDWKTNYKHFMQKESLQYFLAETLLFDITKNYPGKEIIVTGHSLGGSLAEHILANYVSRKEKSSLKLSSYTFNSAGLNPKEYRTAQRSKLGIKGTNFFIVDQNGDKDVVYGLGIHYGEEKALQVQLKDDIAVLRLVPFGALVNLEGKEKAVRRTLARHSIDTVIEALTKPTKTADADFNAFLSKFKSDKTFQLQHIKFPINQGCVWHKEFKTEKIHNKDTWRYENYKPIENTFWKVEKKTETEYRVRAISTSEALAGLMVEHVFRLIGNDWYLVLIEDCTT